MQLSEIDYLKETEYLLKMWGQWSSKGVSPNSYPSSSTFARVPGRSEIISDDKALEIDQAVLFLETVDIVYYEVVILRYQKRMHIISIASDLRISYDRVKRARSEAVCIVMGRIYKNIN